MTEEQTVNIKQRIIGAVFLVSLGVIIIPLLLNGGPDLTQTISSTNIPQKPKELTRELPAIPRPQIKPERKVIEARPVGDFGRTAVSDAKNSLADSSDNKKPVIDPAESVKSIIEKTIAKTITSSNDHYEKINKPTSSKINTAYTLQIASFSQKNNAFALRDKLRKKHFKAYIESLDTSKGKIYRLRVGPYLKFEQISAAKKQIEKQFKVSKTIIVKYKT